MVPRRPPSKRNKRETLGGISHRSSMSVYASMLLGCGHDTTVLFRAQKWPVRLFLLRVKVFFVKLAAQTLS